MLGGAAGGGNAALVVTVARLSLGVSSGIFDRDARCAVVNIVGERGVGGQRFSDHPTWRATPITVFVYFCWEAIAVVARHTLRGLCTGKGSGRSSLRYRQRYR